MRARLGLAGALIAGVALGWPFGLAGSGCAAERARLFIEGLRRRGYHDVVVEYLDHLRQSPDCPADLKEVLDYEAGVTLLAGARPSGPPSAVTFLVRDRELEQARDRFQKFLADRPKHPLAVTAARQLARAIVERGRLKVEQARQASTPPADKQRLLAEARDVYAEAQKAFAIAEKRLQEASRSPPAAPEAKEPNAKPTVKQPAETGPPEPPPSRDTELVQLRLAQAELMYDVAQTYAPGSQEFKDGLEAAAKRYGQIYEKHGSSPGGVEARLWEGRICREIGQTDRALEIFRQLASLPDEPDEFRGLKTKAVALAVETDSQRKNYEDAALLARAWLRSARGSEESSADGLKIRYLAGAASVALAAKLPKEDPKYGEHLAAARKHFEVVARFPGPHQQDAKTQLASELLRSQYAQVKEPANFAEALERGDLAWGMMLAAMEKQPAEAKRDPDKGRWERQQAQRQLDEAREEAARYYRMALRLATREVSREQRNQVRFRLAYLYWTTGDLLEAAVLGEFLARRYPESEAARKGAEIAVKAFRLAFTAALRRQEPTRFEIEHMARVAEMMAQRWPGEPEVDEAWMLLIDSAVENRDGEQALKFLEKIAPTSPRRGQAEIRAGQALWAAYVRASRLPAEERPAQAQLDTLVKQAQDCLAQGIARMRKPVDEGGEPTWALLFSVLALADICVGVGQPEQAIQWLEDPKIGPLTLVAAKHPATNEGEFRVDTYKVAMRAYVGAQQVEKAEKAMDELEKLVAAGREGASAAQLTSIYIALGYQLQGLLERLRSENKLQQAERAARAVEVFLTRIAERKEGNTFHSLSWVAETFMGLGAGFSTGGAKLPATAENYYRKAYDAYMQILRRCADDPKFAPQPGAVDHVKMRMAVCARALGEYAVAMKLLAGILAERENRLDVQIEAALTYQQWGKQNPAYYLRAIAGGYERNGRNLVWGWGGIAAKVSASERASEQFRSVFHQARYQLAATRFELAETQKGDQRAETLQKAELDITRVFRLYPDMGGPEWYEKYDVLLKKIQKARGVAVEGLKGQAAGAAQAPAAPSRAASK